LSRDDPDGAVERLQKAAAAGRDDFAFLTTDPDFQPIRGIPAVRELEREHARISSLSLITDDEQGTRLHVTATVRDPQGQPVPHARVYVFHADAQGHYSHNGVMDERHARLFGYLLTGEQGEFQFDTVRPGGYPVPAARSADEKAHIPQHIHVQIEASGFQFYNQQWVFEDDPRMTSHWRQWAAKLQRPILRVVRDDQQNERAICEVILQR
jgi:protocatechuate 3,4-dioxygenase beta subunit